MTLYFQVIFYILYYGIVLACCIVVLSENRNPVKALAWVLALLFLPGVGLVFYLFFGRNIQSLRLTIQNKRRLLHRAAFRRKSPREVEATPDNRTLNKLSNRLVDTPLSANNSIEYFTDGASKFAALKRDLENARSWICMQYYIFKDDRLGHEIADILTRKASEGVVVYLIYDHVGSFSAPRGFFKRMRKAGVKAHPFFRVTFPQLANRINWRNHRKITVIDGAVGYLGGMNVAQRYTDNPRWQDLHFRLTGDIVDSLLYSFAVDWQFKHLPLELPETPRGTHPDGNVAMQLVTCGPTDEYNNLSMVFLKAIASAKKSILIETPYFLPPEALLTALEAAALSGVDVRIVLPRHSDSRLIQYGSFSYVTRCLMAGIKVYLYEEGMLHSKIMMVDDELVTAGSTNFDFRSFENNFECNLFIYDRDFHREMKEVFFRNIRSSTKLTMSLWRRRPFTQKSLEAIVKLFSPIL